MTDVSRLPGPFEHQWDWQEQAACRDADSRIFFHPSGERGSAHRAREAEAQRICSRCPVQLACRRYALDARESYGVWGGLTEEDRQPRIRSRSRSRARAAGAEPGDRRAG